MTKAFADLSVMNISQLWMSLFSDFEVVVLVFISLIFVMHGQTSCSGWFRACVPVGYSKGSKMTAPGANQPKIVCKPTSVDRPYRGRIYKYGPTWDHSQGSSRGYGWIHCEQLKDVVGKTTVFFMAKNSDVDVSEAQKLPSTLNLEVEFRVATGLRNWEAFNVKTLSDGDIVAGPVIGRVKSFAKKTGYGFIYSAGLQEFDSGYHFENGMFFNVNSSETWSVSPTIGDRCRFHVRRCAKGFEACSLEWLLADAAPSHADEQVPGSNEHSIDYIAPTEPLLDPMAVERPCRGRVRRYGPGNGYGFIYSEQLKDVVGKVSVLFMSKNVDVDLTHDTGLPTIGSEVEFRVAESAHGWEALNVQVLCGDRFAETSGLLGMASEASGLAPCCG